MVGPSGFEPPTSTAPSWRAAKLRYGPTPIYLLVSNLMLIIGVSPSSPRIDLFGAILIQIRSSGAVRSPIQEAPGWEAGSHRPRW